MVQVLAVCRLFAPMIGEMSFLLTRPSQKAPDAAALLPVPVPVPVTNLMMVALHLRRLRLQMGEHLCAPTYSYLLYYPKKLGLGRLL